MNNCRIGEWDEGTGWASNPIMKSFWIVPWSCGHDVLLSDCVGDHAVCTRWSNGVEGLDFSSQWAPTCHLGWAWSAACCSRARWLTEVVIVTSGCVVGYSAQYVMASSWATARPKRHWNMHWPTPPTHPPTGTWWWGCGCLNQWHV